MLHTMEDGDCRLLPTSKRNSMWYLHTALFYTHNLYFNWLTNITYLTSVRFSLWVVFISHTIWGSFRWTNYSLITMENKKIAVCQKSHQVLFHASYKDRATSTSNLRRKEMWNCGIEPNKSALWWSPNPSFFLPKSDDGMSPANGRAWFWF